MEEPIVIDDSDIEPIDAVKDEYRVPRPTKIRLKETKSERADKIYQRERRRAEKERRRIRKANGFGRGHGVYTTPPPIYRVDSTSPPRNPPEPQPRSAASTTSDTELKKNDEEGWEELSYSIRPRSNSPGPNPLPSSSTNGRSHPRPYPSTSSKRPPQARPTWGTGQSLRETLESDDITEKIHRLAREELDLDSSDPFGLYADDIEDEIPIPKRWRDAAGPSLHAAAASSSSSSRYNIPFGFSSTSFARYPHTSPQYAERHANPFLHQPRMGNLTEEEYATKIREGMYAHQNRTELAAAAARQKAQLEAELARQKAKSQAEKAERERIRLLEREAAEKRGWEREKEKQDYRVGYVRRWGKLRSGLVEAVELGWEGIPWPVYPTQKRIGLGDITVINVKLFLTDLSKDPPSSGPAVGVAGGGNGSGGGGGGGGGGEMKKILREAILTFHPDRFFSRFLSLVKESDRSKVREGVEVCSRVINELLGK